MPSPPPPYNFAVIPTVASRHPLWEDRLDESDARSNLGEGLILDQGKEDAGDHRRSTPSRERILQMPGDTLIPFLLALGMMVLFSRAAHPQRSDRRPRRARLRRLDLVAWLWPRRELCWSGGRSMAELMLAQPAPLPVGRRDGKRVGWGLAALIASEAALFGYLLFAIIYTGASAPGGLGARAASQAAPGAAEYVHSPAVQRCNVVRRTSDPPRRTRNGPAGTGVASYSE